MTNTLWSDVSEWQCVVDDSYPYKLLAIRSNDGTYLDRNFTANYAWARSALASGRLWGLIVYYFYRPYSNGAGVLRARVGRPLSRMIVMIDVESDEGRVSGNHSREINAEYSYLANWIGDRRRVIGYGNVGDIAGEPGKEAIWPNRPAGLRLVIAAYDSNPAFPGKFAHQFTNRADTPPFGPSDLNSADGMSESDLKRMFGFANGDPTTKEEYMNAGFLLPGKDVSGGTQNTPIVVVAGKTLRLGCNSAADLRVDFVIDSGHPDVESVDVSLDYNHKDVKVPSYCSLVVVHRPDGGNSAVNFAVV